MNIEVHTLERHFAIDECDTASSYVLDKGRVMHDGADSPDDLPLVRGIGDVADLDFHEVEGEGERKKKVWPVIALVDDCMSLSNRGCRNPHGPIT